MDITLDMVVVDCDRYVLIMPRGEIDTYTESSFRRQVLGAVGDRPLVIDMSDVTFCDCSALNVIVLAEQRCRVRNTLLAIAGLRPYAAQVFRFARIDGIVPLCPTIQEAVWCVAPLTDEEIAAWPWPH